MENHPYAPAEIEPYWQAEWREKEAFKVPNAIEVLKTKPKFYVLGMSPILQGLDCTWGMQKTTYQLMYSPIFGGCKGIM